MRQIRIGWMLLDYTSLLLSIGIAAGALMMTLLVGWLSARQDRYLLSWAVGIAVSLPAIASFGLVPEPFDPKYYLVGFLLLFTGLSFVAAGAQQFRTGHADIRTLSALLALSTMLTTLSFGFGLSGVGVAAGNIGCAILFALAGREYWLGRSEAPLPLVGKAILYVATAISFTLCGLLLLAEGQFVLTARPQNWAEDVNAIMLIVSLAGIGALALTLRQVRSGKMDHTLARTDQLTGLLNRRALFEAFGTDGTPPGAVIMTDIDHFKSINDGHGHSAGDEVLVIFAQTLRDTVRDTDQTFRLGGEEFCVVVEAGRTGAVQLAERIRTTFALRMTERSDYGPVTVSAGVAVATRSGEPLEALLRRADQALYRAKSEGRDQVQGPLPQLVA